jgi:4-hydroxy-tetrahydrodipicolinate reductase
MALSVAISGAGGRMGRALIEAVLQAPDLTLHAALEAHGNALLGRDAGELAGTPCGIALTADAQALAGAQVLIDFTRPDATLGYLRACGTHGVNVVTGTTGFSPEARERVTEAAASLAVVMAPNMSVGTNLVFKLIAEAA